MIPITMVGRTLECQHWFPDQNQFICLGNVGTMYERYRATLNTQSMFDFVTFNQSTTI